MFTGIIRYQGEVVEISSARGGKRFLVEAPQEVLECLEEGITSVALDGSCHTVEKVKEKCFQVYSSFETLKRTTLNEISVGRKLNLELPLTPQTFFDGHMVMGHVDGVGRILFRRSKGDSALYRFEVSDELSVYLVEKDSIAIDGISLTIFDIEKRRFSVAVIPQTLKHTTLFYKGEGEMVNVEVHVLAKYGYVFTNQRNRRAMHLEEWLRS